MTPKKRKKTGVWILGTRNGGTLGAQFIFLECADPVMHACMDELAGAIGSGGFGLWGLGLEMGLELGFGIAAARSAGPGRPRSPG